MNTNCIRLSFRILMNTCIVICTIQSLLCSYSKLLQKISKGFFRNRIEYLWKKSVRLISESNELLI